MHIGKEKYTIKRLNHTIYNFNNAQTKAIANINNNNLFRLSFLISFLRKTKITINAGAYKITIDKFVIDSSKLILSIYSLDAYAPKPN